jgi:hypothetical protein
VNAIVAIGLGPIRANTTGHQASISAAIRPASQGVDGDVDRAGLDRAGQLCGDRADPARRIGDALLDRVDQRGDDEAAERAAPHPPAIDDVELVVVAGGAGRADVAQGGHLLLVASVAGCVRSGTGAIGRSVR